MAQWCSAAARAAEQTSAPAARCHIRTVRQCPSLSVSNVIRGWIVAAKNTFSDPSLTLNVSSVQQFYDMLLFKLECVIETYLKPSLGSYSNLGFAKMTFINLSFLHVQLYQGQSTSARNFCSQTNIFHLCSAYFWIYIHKCPF